MLWWGLVLSTRPSRSTHEAVRLLSRHTTIINVQCLVTVDEVITLDNCVPSAVLRQTMMILRQTMKVLGQKMMTLGQKMSFLPADHYSHLRIDYLMIEMKNGVKSKTGP